MSTSELRINYTLNPGRILDVKIRINYTLNPSRQLDVNIRISYTLNPSRQLDVNIRIRYTLNPGRILDVNIRIRYTLNLPKHSSLIKFVAGSFRLCMIMFNFLRFRSICLANKDLATSYSLKTSIPDSSTFSFCFTDFSTLSSNVFHI